MVVVVILAVLGALVVPKILENVDKARSYGARRAIFGRFRRRWTCTGSITSNTRPPNRDLQALVKQPADPTITNYHSDGYLKSLPKDPWGNPYLYASPGADGRDYDIITYGRDGKPGGEGYDADISTAHSRSEIGRAARAVPQHAQQGLYAGRDLGGGRDHRHRHFARVSVVGITGRDTQLDEESRRIEGLVGLAARTRAVGRPRFRPAHRAHRL